METEKRLIDATPLIDECKECSAIEWNKGVYTTWAEAEEDFMKRLLDAPTVDAVEVVHGHWIPVPSSDMMTGKAYKCSECGKMRYGSYMPNYCQCCGAKMDMEVDS